MRPPKAGLAVACERIDRDIRATPAPAAVPPARGAILPRRGGYRLSASTRITVGTADEIRRLPAPLDKVPA